MSDMTAQEAVDVLRENIYKQDNWRGCYAFNAAISALRDTNIYGSRFKPGDLIWELFESYADGISLRWDSTAFGNVVDAVYFSENGCAYFTNSCDEGAPTPETDCFATEAEAKAECAKRNEGRE